MEQAMLGIAGASCACCLAAQLRGQAAPVAWPQNRLGELRRPPRRGIAQGKVPVSA
jgi:hypothetical protein